MCSHTMTALASLGRIIGKITLSVGFIGIGLLGVALVIMAVTYPTTLYWRVIVIGMGILAIMIAVGTGMTAKNRPTPHAPR